MNLPVSSFFFFFFFLPKPVLFSRAPSIFNFPKLCWKWIQFFWDTLWELSLLLWFVSSLGPDLSQELGVGTMALFSLSDIPALVPGHLVAWGLAAASCQLAFPGMATLLMNESGWGRLGPQYLFLSTPCTRQSLPPPDGGREEGSASLYAALLQNLASVAISWGRMRTADILPFLGRYCRAPAGSWGSQRAPCAIGCAHLEWLFQHAELGGEREEVDHSSNTSDFCCLLGFLG